MYDKFYWFINQEQFTSRLHERIQRKVAKIQL